MSAHTPGPWLRDGECVYALEKVRGRHGLGERNRVYFWIQGGPDTPKAEVIATAALAQAAPDMYEALIDLLQAGGMDNAGEYARAAKKARAAIAKARGES